MRYQRILEDHKQLDARRGISERNMRRIEEALEKKLGGLACANDFCVFAAGSIGRGDCGKKSDSDLFVISRRKLRNLEKQKIIASLIECNDSLGFPEVSNDGQYLGVHCLDDMRSALGNPADDFTNLFTTRMLMVLESKVVFGEEAYNEALRNIVGHYFRDEEDHKGSFLPIFILNDILRFWRTMCLNYEVIRNDSARPWRKKNINLKFSRMLSVFSMVMPIMVGLADKVEDLFELTRCPPLDRIAKSLDKVGAVGFEADFGAFLEDYEAFLSWKEREDIDSFIEISKNKAEIKAASQRFSEFFYRFLMDEFIDENIRKYLVI